MLIRFTVENFLSFNKRIDFNMLANEKDESFANHIVKATNNNEVDLLRATLIYGENSSGKSNLIKAIDFAQQLIIKGIEDDSNIVYGRVSSPNFYFKLNPQNQTQPTRFEFEIKYKNKQYAYGFVFTKTNILEEWLYEIGKLGEKEIYSRKNELITINFEHQLFANLQAKDRQRLEFEAESSKRNLFLHSINQKDKGIDLFSNIYDWFRNVLTIIFPKTSANLLLPLKFEKDFEEKLNTYITNYFGFDIQKVKTEKILLKNAPDIPQFIKDDLIKTTEYGKQQIRYLPLTPPYLIEDDGQNLFASKLVTYRKDSNKEEVAFDFTEESDGTRRIFDFIPMLISFAEGNKVFIIDEVERSLHALLSKQLFQLLLNETQNSESQLIATTHEVQLMDIKSLFRKDEIWLVEKNEQGETDCYSLAGTNLDGLDLIKGYLKGRYGAIPFFKTTTELGWEHKN
jgi:AAA15 family ATPase/GTPase